MLINPEARWKDKANQSRYTIGISTEHGSNEVRYRGMGSLRMRGAGSRCHGVVSSLRLQREDFATHSERLFWCGGFFL